MCAGRPCSALCDGLACKRLNCVGCVVWDAAVGLWPLLKLLLFGLCVHSSVQSVQSPFSLLKHILISSCKFPHASSNDQRTAVHILLFQAHATQARHVTCFTLPTSSGLMHLPALLRVLLQQSCEQPQATSRLACMCRTCTGEPHMQCMSLLK